MPPYEELFASGKGFTDVEEARRFAEESGCDWLSVAVGNIHGAIAAGRTRPEEARSAAQPGAPGAAERGDRACPSCCTAARASSRSTCSGSFKHGITKVNVGTEIRQAYEQSLRATNDVEAAQQACYDRTYDLLTEFFCIAGIQKQVVV